MKKSGRKKQQSSLIINIIFSLIALFALTVGIAVLLMNYSLKQKITLSQRENEELQNYAKNHKYTQEDMDKLEYEVRNEEKKDEKAILLEKIKETMANGYSAYYLLRDLFPDDVVVLSDGGYDFFPITKDLPQNNYQLKNFIQDEETKEVVYTDESGEVISHKGIDVSSHNGEIDWKKVKEDGVEFAFIRVGFRGSTEGKLVLDTEFENNIKGAIKNGIDVGVYFYTQAINEEEAEEEAQYVLDAIEPYSITYPVIYDIEEYKDGRAYNLDMEVYTACTKAFLEKIKKAGYKPMVYGNLKTFFLMLEQKELTEYEKWFAYYIYPVYNPYEYAVWQYTSAGKIDGIKGDVDLNILLKDLKEE